MAPGPVAFARQLADGWSAFADRVPGADRDPARVRDRGACRRPPRLRRRSRKSRHGLDLHALSAPRGSPRRAQCHPIARTRSEHLQASAIPPAAGTGTGVAALSTGTRAGVPISQRTCPHASRPCAMMASTPASTARRLPRPSRRCAPASWIIPTQGEGSPQNMETRGLRRRGRQPGVHVVARRDGG